MMERKVLACNTLGRKRLENSHLFFFSTFLLSLSSGSDLLSPGRIWRILQTSYPGSSVFVNLTAMGYLFSITSVILLFCGNGLF